MAATFTQSPIQQYLDTNCTAAANEGDLQKNLCEYARTILGMPSDQSGPLVGQLNAIQDQLNAHKKADKELRDKRAQIKRELGLLEDSEDVLITRKRMLELSDEKNEFKQKTIYTLISAIIGVILLLIVLYSFFFSN